MANKLVLDTNIWIYLTKENYEPLYESLRQKVADKEVEILVNDVIILEWYRNKEKTIKSLLESITNEYKSAKNLIKFLPDEQKDTFNLLLESINSNDKRRQKAELRVDEIEKLILNSKKIDVTDEQKLFVAKMAIEKKGPFSNNKNNFNDTLILRNIIEHCESQSYPYQYDLIYVSNNPKDFCIDGKEEIYPEIIDGFESLRIKSVTELGYAFELSSELIEDFDDWLDWQVEMWAEYQADLARGK